MSMRLFILLILLLSFAPAARAADTACLTSDTACILQQAVDSIDPASIKAVQDQNHVLGAAASVVLLGDAKLQQQVLDKLDKIPGDLTPQKRPIPNTTPEHEKAHARMILLAALGRIDEVVKIIREMKDKDEAFHSGLDPQLRVFDRLVVTGKLDDAKKLMAETVGFRFKSTGTQTLSPEGAIIEWRWAQGPPALLMLKALLNAGKEAEARDFASYLRDENAFSNNVGDLSIREMFARYAAAKERPGQSFAPAATPAADGNYAERDKVLALLNAGKTPEAQFEVDNFKVNREALLRNVINSFNEADKKPPRYDEIWSFYMKACPALYPALVTGRTRCLLMLLVNAAGEKERAINAEFNRQYPPVASCSADDGASCR
jgi:hypothetical protein